MYLCIYLCTILPMYFVPMYMNHCTCTMYPYTLADVPIYICSTYVPIYLCTYVPMNQYTCVHMYYVPIYLCTYVLCTNIPVYLCTNIPVYLCIDIPMYLCINILVYLCTNIPVYLCTYEPMFLYTYVHIYLCTLASGRSQPGLEGGFLNNLTDSIS